MASNTSGFDFIKWLQDNLLHLVSVGIHTSKGDGATFSEEKSPSPLMGMLASLLSRADSAAGFETAMRALNISADVKITAEIIENVTGAFRRLKGWQIGQVYATLYFVVGNKGNEMFKHMLDAMKSKGDDKESKDEKGKKGSKPNVGAIVEKMLAIMTSDTSAGNNDLGKKLFFYLNDRLTATPLKPASNIADLCIGLQLCDANHPAQEVIDFFETTFNEVAERILVPLNAQLVRFNGLLTFHIERYVDPNTRQERREVHAAAIGRGAHVINNTARLVGGIATVLLLLLLLLVS